MSFLSNTTKVNSLTRTFPTLKQSFNKASSRHLSSQAFTKRTLNFALGTTTVLGIGLFSLYAFNTRSSIHELVFAPLLRQLDEEVAHDLSIKLLSWNLGPKDHHKDSELLETQLWGKRLSNPLGMAAGYDKNAQIPDKILKLGFGAVEVGSITPLPQSGNPSKRLFRLNNTQAIINRMGLNNDGIEECKKRLEARFWKNATEKSANDNHSSQSITSLADSVPKSGIDGRLLGVNVSKNSNSPSDSDSDFLTGIKELGPFADYIVINISCPNVENLSSGSNMKMMDKTVSAARAECNNLGDKKPALVIKIGPDYSENELKIISQIALKNNVDGIIATNTSRSRPEYIFKDEPNAKNAGGLSGPPIKNLALNTTRLVYKYTDKKIPIIGCGGVSTAQDVLEYGRAGASFVQLYTSMIYQGPGVASKIKDDLTVLLDGQKWSDIIGTEYSIY
ncbi:hypothetical protein BB561_005089 [Smittium simulii]|uniref:Dihydroorotate dehydrogenase (quinone), mitochondrial n=1 Tax=Smittium simulii TaxID=133385 RepID=A0A2T9YCB1_9FUNG|nr:hypothetical protein BB561_005089 [Smittium simulii]